MNIFNGLPVSWPLEDQVYRAVLHGGALAFYCTSGGALDSALLQALLSLRTGTSRPIYEAHDFAGVRWPARAHNRWYLAGGFLMTIPQGVRFSLNYGSRGEPVEDSERMRRRINRLFTVGEFDDVVTADLIELGVGVAVPRWPSGSAKWEVFFQSCALKDFLDVITVVARGLRAVLSPNYRAGLVQLV